MTIYYMCPDFTRASAGTRTLYLHVKYLNNSGIDACIVHLEDGFTMNWHGIDVPVKYLSKIFIEAEDILVFPETSLKLLASAKPLVCTKVMIVLNWAHFIEKLPNGSSWRSYGIEYALSPSHYICDFVKWTMNIPCTYFDCAIDKDLYYYEAHNKDTRVISHMTRKQTSGLMVERLLNLHGDQYQGLDWRAMHDLPEETYADNLRVSGTYLATGNMEGLNISVIEAMACGCLVIGYTGGGGKDYMTGDGDGKNCLIVDTDDYYMMVRTLEQVLENWAADPTYYDNVIKNGLKTAENFLDVNAEKKSVRDFFQKLLQK